MQRLLFLMISLLFLSEAYMSLVSMPAVFKSNDYKGKKSFLMEKGLLLNRQKQSTLKVYKMPENEISSKITIKSFR
ncbi:MAG: hypothetical protein N3A59_08765 [Thermodesulfovibrionales bacterium]|nr:hypothetical protein [Thermodesulfovibrionales bacterium]